MSQSSYYPPPSTLLHPDKFPINNLSEKFGTLLGYFGFEFSDDDKSWFSKSRRDLTYFDDVVIGAGGQSDYIYFTLCYLIPKLWVKYKKTNTGKMWLFSNTPKPGYHLHPAFYDNKGQEVKEGILIWRGNFLLYPNTLKYIVQYYHYVGASDCDFVKFSRKHAQEIVTEFNLAEYFGRLKSQVSQEEYDAAVNDLDSYPEHDAGWHLYNIYEDSLVALLDQTICADTYYPQFNESLVFPEPISYSTGLEVRKSNDNEGQAIWSLYLLDPKSREMKNTGLRVGKELRQTTLLTNQTEYYNDEYLQDIFLPKPSARDNYPILSTITKPTKSSTWTVSDKYGEYVCDYTAGNSYNGFMLKKERNANSLPRVVLEDVDGKKAYAGYGSSFGSFTNKGITTITYWVYACVDVVNPIDVMYPSHFRNLGNAISVNEMYSPNEENIGGYLRLAKYI